MSEELFGNIYDIQRFSVHDGPGIRTDIFTKGCPLRCLWCHSPESQTFGPDLAWMDIRCIGMDQCALCMKACGQGAISVGEPHPTAKGDEIVRNPVVDRAKCVSCFQCADACPSAALYNTQRRVTVEECMKSIRQDARYYAKSGGGVTISGGEPMSQFSFTLALAKQCRAEGFHVALDTTGFAPTEHYLEILPYVNLFLFDLKCMDSKRSEELVGVPNELILKNARELVANGGRLQVRYPVIPTMNDSEENIRATAEFCAGIRAGIDVVQLLPYHRLGVMKYIRLGRSYPMDDTIEAPPAAFMQHVLSVFQEYDLPAQIG